MDSSETTDPLLHPPTSLDTICYDITNLQNLARLGSWRSIIDRVNHARKYNLIEKPHEQLAYLAYSVMALAKLRKYSDAMEELDSIDHFDHPQYRYESHPSIYPNMTGSMIPFALRWLHAQLPFKLGKKQESSDRLYGLLEFVSGNKTLRGISEFHPPESALGQPGMTGNEPGMIREVDSAGLKDSCDVIPDGFCEKFTWSVTDFDNIWKRREEIVINSIICQHLMQKEYPIALKWMERLIQQSPHNVFLVSKLGQIQLQIGDLKGADASFSRVEEMVSLVSRNGEVGTEIKNLLNRNRALRYMVAKDYVTAVREYEEAIERDPGDIIATNNKALCLMYSRDLLGSIKVLENALERVPSAALNESIVLNLCSMYELAYVSNSDAKRSLSAWILQVAPDDFDMSCTRL